MLIEHSPLRPIKEASLGRISAEEVAEDDKSGGAIKPLAERVASKTGFAQHFFGFARGQAFILKVDGQSCRLADLFGGGAGLLGGLSFAAIHTKRQSDDDRAHFEFAAERGEMCGELVGATDRRKGARSETKLIRDG